MTAVRGQGRRRADSPVPVKHSACRIPSHSRPLRRASWNQIEGRHMHWPHDREVPSVKRCDSAGAQALGGRDDGCVDRAQRKVAIGRDQFGDAKPVGRLDLLRHEFARGQVPNEAHLCLHSDSRLQEVRDLRDDKHRDQDRSGVGLEKAPATTVLSVVRVVGRVEWAGVGDQWPASSDRSISSIRCETSLLPLRPAAPNRRLPPGPKRWVSMASRVTSEIVMPRRSAS